MTLTDLLTPTFFIILGIVLLIVALVVVYFENKTRDQNHKIASMLSLVSTLAEDMNRVKLGMNRLAMTPSIEGSIQQPLEQLRTVFNSNGENKITVSDDEDAASEIEDDSEIDDSEIDETDHDDDVSDNDTQNDEIKVLKLNINKEENNEDIGETLELDATDELDDLEELDDNLSDTHSETSMLSEEDEFSLQYENNSTSLEPVSMTELKTININLEEPDTETLDYKKLPLPKLRSIVAEKGLSVDAPKLKKNELLKLLENE